MYKCTDYYDASDEAGLAWDDPAVGIEWPLDRVGEREKLKISERDKKWPNLDKLDVDFDYDKYKI